MSRIKLLNIVGARPQIIKASAISRNIRSSYADRIEEKILHTGQHYDRQMSGIFFDELEIPFPDYNLGVGSARHGKQTASMISGIEEILISDKPDVVVIYGDTNSTLAAAIANSKLHIPIVHVEAGLRSFNKLMPEEVNRILSDHVSTLLFAPTNAALKNLMHEGFSPGNSPPFNIDNPKIFLSGDIMYDNSLFFSELAIRKLDGWLDNLGLSAGKYLLCTIHRDNNTDDPHRLESIISSLISIADKSGQKVVLPLHPRTVNALEKHNRELLSKLEKHELIRVLPPVSYLEMILLERSSSIIITDSGGVQKESHFFSRPCIVLRAETEWVELVENKTVILADADYERIFNAFVKLTRPVNRQFPTFYGDGNAAGFILKEIVELFN